MMETLNKNAYWHYASPKTEQPRGKKQPRSRFCKALILGGLLCFVVLLAVGLAIEHPWNPVYGSEVEAGTVREIPSPGYPASPVPDEQLSIASEDAPESLVVQEQEGKLHARSYTEEQVAEHNNFARRYTKENQMAGRDEAVQEQWPPPFRLPKLPIPSDILDIPIKIPTHISDILGDLPLPTIPTHPSDIIDVLPTEIISDLPIPTLPPAPPAPTLPIPVPIPTKIPELPSGRPTHPDDPPFPLPTILPPSKPRDPGDGFGLLPDIIEIPHKILGLLHHAVAQLSLDPNLPRPIRNMLRLIQRIIERIAGGPAVPKPPKKPKPTVSLPIPTNTKIPIPTLPIPTLPKPTLPTPTPPKPTLPTTLPTDETTLLPPPPETSSRSRRPPLFPPPRPTLTLPLRAARKQARDVSSDDDKEPLSEGERKMLRDKVSDEVWGSVDWSNPIVAPLTAAAAMIAFDSVYRVAEAFKGAEDEDEEGRERLLGLLVVVDDDGDDGEAMA